MRLVKDADERARKFTGALAHAAASDAPALAAKSRELRVVATGGQLVLGDANVYEYDVTKKIREPVEKAGQETVKHALDDPSAEIRLLCQGLMPEWEATTYASYNLGLPKNWSRELSKILAGGGLGLISAALGWTLTQLLGGHLHVHLAWLALLHLGIVLGFLYWGLIAEESEEPSLALKVLDAVLMPIRKRHHNSVAAPFVWPLPGIIVAALSLLLAAVFHAVGWPSTAGFVVGVLWSGIGVAFGTIWASDV